MATDIARAKPLPGFKWVVDTGSCESSGVIITDAERARTAQYMKERGITRGCPGGGCTFVPRPVSELSEALISLEVEHAHRLRQMETEGRLVMG
jgi:hypothetical protein